MVQTVRGCSEEINGDQVHYMIIEQRSTGLGRRLLKNNAAIFAVIAIIAAVIAYVAMTANVMIFLDPRTYVAWHDFFQILMFTTPVFFVLQVSALLLLSWRIIHRKNLVIGGTRSISRWLLLLGVAVAPAVMLATSVVFVGGYQKQYGHWFYHTNDGFAGLILVPFYVVGSAIIARGLLRSDYRLNSGSHFVVLLTLMVVCVWYVFTTAVLDMVTDPLGDMSETAVVPGVAAANYALLAIEIKRCRLLEPARKPAILIWFSALTVTLIAKIPLAMRLFDALPVQSPKGYGDCFIVSAAALGHPRFVGSRLDPATGRCSNDQLSTLSAFEDSLANSRPTTHRHLRRIYNRVGPRIAACIWSPYIGDAVYLLLKPAEWLARLYLATRSERERL